MDEFSIEYDFEELRPVDERGRPIFGDGVLYDGVATLASDGDGSFYVRDIRLGDEWLSQANHGAYGQNTYRAHTYRAISDALYASSDANATWADAYSDSGEPITAVYSTLNHDAQGLSGVAA